MTLRKTPKLDARYWVALLVASILGCNMGDLFAHDLGLGHVLGLAPLALIFAGILTIERRTRNGSEAFYWLIVLTLRTAATNLGDLATHDLKFSVAAVMAVLTALTALVWAVDRRRNGAESAGETQLLGGVDLLYWLAMLIAGTLGTVAGDALADDLIGLGPACVVSLIVLGGILGARIAAGLADRASYWVVIVAVRTAGTNLGDYFAGRHGLNVGLRADAALFGLLLVALLMLWPRRAALRTQET